MRDLQLLMPSYRATRVLWELVLETLPMSILQLHIYATLKWYEVYAPDERPALQSGLAPLLAGSLTLSVVNLVKCSLLLRWEAQAVGVGVLAHLGQQLQLGRGLPLHALRAQRIDAWQCTVELREETLRELCAALRRNRSLRLLGCSRAGIDAAGGVALATMLRANCSLTSLDLSRNQLGGGSLEWARALADSLRDNGTLLSLSLAHNNVGVRACAVLATGLEANTALYTLDLSHNRVLGLDGIGLGEYCPDGALALCRALEANTSLQHLLLEGNQLSAAPLALRRALARNDAVLRLSFSLGGAAAAAAAAHAEEALLPLPLPQPLPQPHSCLGVCRSQGPRALGRLQVEPRPETEPAVLTAAEAEAEIEAEIEMERQEQERQLMKERPPPAPDCSPRRRGHHHGRPVFVPSLSPARLATCSPGRRVAGASFSEYQVVLEEARERPRGAYVEEIEFELESVEEPQPEGHDPRRV